MNVTFPEKKEVWRGPGHPRRNIPAQVRRMADETYKTGRVGVVAFGPEDEGEVNELCKLLNSYAKSLNRVMRIQIDEPDDDCPGELRFELADKRMTS